MSVDYSAIKASIVTDLTAELSSDADFSSAILANKVEIAIRDVMLHRNYSASGMTDAQIADDLNNYYSVIENVARYDYNQVGVEGQKSHNENSISRTWVDRDSLFGSVYAFVKVL